MKRWLIIGGLLSASLLVFFSWGIYFLLWTPEGARWLLEKVQPYARAEIRVAKINGRLAGDISLEGLQVRWKGGGLDVDHLQTSLRPRHLLRGKIQWKEVTVKGISLAEQETPPQPVDLTLPGLPAWLGRLDFEIEALQLERIRYRYNQDPPWNIPGIAGRVAWKGGTLAVNPLDMTMESGRLQGHAGLGLAVPFLELEARFTPKSPLAGMDQFRLQARLKQGRSPVQLAGALTLTGRAGSVQRLAIQSPVEVGPHRIVLTRAAVRESNRRGTAAGRGEIIFEASGTSYRADLKLTEVDLSSELKLPVRLTGDLLFAGTPSRYSGRFDLQNNPSSWQKFRLTGTYQGNESAMEVGLDRGDWLRGAFGGRIALNWDKDFILQASLAGREIRPETIDPGWPGLINLDLKGSLRWPRTGRPLGALDLRLLDSQFQKKILKGGLSVDFQEDRLFVKKAELEGRGFNLKAAGSLDDRLNFEGRLGDLNPLWSAGRGSGSARGWVRWRNKKWSGRIVGQGRNFSWNQVRAGIFELDATVDQEKTDTGVEAQARIKSGAYGGIPLDSMALRIGGTLANQAIRVAVDDPQGRMQVALSGAWDQGGWQGTLVTLEGAFPRDQAFRLLAPTPVVFRPDRLRISSLVLAGEGEERLNLDVDLGLSPLAGALGAEWQRLKLVRAGPWLGKMNPRGTTDGALRARFPGKERLDLQVHQEMSGQFRLAGRAVDLKRAGFDLTWNDGGLRSAWEIKLATGEAFSGQAASTEKARLAFPAQGTLRSSLQDFNLENWKTVFPAGLSIQGKAGGRLQGQWSAGRRWQLTGDLEVVGGAVAWKNNGTEFQARLSRAEGSIRWQEETLQGRLALDLEKVGKAAGEFSLPLPARWPLKMEATGPVYASLSGGMRENGLVTSLFPAAVRSSRGNLKWDLTTRGTWEKPIPSGAFELSEAGADLPSLGIRLQEVAVRGGLREDGLNIESLVLRSGPGTLNGRGEIRLKEGRIVALQGRITGKNFQFVNRPDLQALGNPELEWTGTPDLLRVSGKIEIPEALISGGSVQGTRKASSDVVFVDVPGSRAQEKPFPIRGEVDLLFGEKVRIKMEGLNTLLTGRVRVALANSKDLKAEGEIRADQGYYLVQGSRLEITRGRLIFKGPPDNPALDLLALRTIRGSQRLEDRADEVRAGVVVTGTVRSPLVRLYSQPSLPDSDILSYILFGKPLGRGTDRTDLALLGKAARSLLGGKTESSLLGKLDLDTIDIQSDGGDMSRSMVTVGKYLDPRLYLGLGGSLFSNTYQVILRYALTPRLELETKGGTQSGGGIFFKADFE